MKIVINFLIKNLYLNFIIFIKDILKWCLKVNNLGIPIVQVLFNHLNNQMKVQMKEIVSKIRNIFIFIGVIAQKKKIHRKKLGSK